MTVIEVFADVLCPFTHVGLRRFVEQRAERGRTDVGLRVRSWPLEVVNGSPLEAAVVAEEIVELRTHVAPALFVGFDEAAFPGSSLPALALAAAAYERDDAVGERVSLALREQLFEQGRDIADPAVLEELARAEHLQPTGRHHQQVLADHAEGGARGVVGSPHFFTPAGGFFCPSLDVSRDDAGALQVRFDPAAFDEFLAACFA